MNDRQKIELEVLENLLDNIKAMYPEYIVEYIREQINQIKHGI
jgi:hypothetical protein